jgi:hypothetical protein
MVAATADRRRLASTTATAMIAAMTAALAATIDREPCLRLHRWRNSPQRFGLNHAARYRRMQRLHEVLAWAEVARPRPAMTSRCRVRRKNPEFRAASSSIMSR